MSLATFSSLMWWYSLTACTLMLCQGSIHKEASTVVACVDLRVASISAGSFIFSNILFLFYTPNYCRICQPRFKNEFIRPHSNEGFRPHVFVMARLSYHQEAESPCSSSLDSGESFSSSVIPRHMDLMHFHTIAVIFFGLTNRSVITLPV